MKNVGKLLKPVFIGFLVVSWLLSGWPTIPYINFPPRIEEVEATTYGTYTFDVDGDSDESAWTWDNPAAVGDGLGTAGSPVRAWSWDDDKTASTSSDVGPECGQGGGSGACTDGYVYTEMSTDGAFNDEFNMVFNTALDASAESWVVTFYTGQRGDANDATVVLQTNENGAGWVSRGSTFGGASDPTKVASGGTPQNWALRTVDLEGLISDASTQIRLHVVMPASGTTWHNDYGIDTVTITGTSANAAPAAPTLNTPFDNEKTGDSTPVFTFTADDPDGTAGITYHIEVDDDYAFGSMLINCESDTSCTTGAGSFTRSGDSDPFTEGQEVTFTPTTTMTTVTTYYWRVRAEDNAGEGGSGSYGAWSDIHSVTYVSGTSPSEWHQTTDEQFDSGTLSETGTTGSDSVQLSSGSGIEIDTGRFTVTTGTGTQDVDTVPFEPKAVITVLTTGTSDDATGTNSRISIGMATENDEFCMSSFDLANGTDTGRRASTNDMICAYDDGSQASLGEAAFASFNADGFTFNKTVAFSSPASPLAQYIALGGSDVSVKVGTASLNTTQNGTTVVSDVGFEPDVVLTSYIGHFADDGGGDSENDDFAMSLGWAVNPDVQASNNQYSYSAGDIDGSENYDSRFDTANAGHEFQDGNTSSAYELTAFDGSGFTITTRLTGAAATDAMGYLAIDFGDSPELYTTSRTALTSTGDDDETGSTFEPIFLLGVGGAVATSADTNTAEGSWSMGMTDGTDTYAIHYFGTGGSGNGSSVTNTQFWKASSTSTINYEADFTSFNADGWTLTYGDGASSGYQQAFLAVGGGAAASSGTIMSSVTDYDLVDAGDNGWDEVTWDETESPGTISVRVLGTTTVDCDTELVSADTTSPASLSAFDGSGTSNRICLEATLTDSGGTPFLNDWTVTWASGGASPTFTQNDYRWYVDSDGTNPTEVWGAPDIAENTAIVVIPTGNDPPNSTQELRLRANFTVNTANLTATSQQFDLQFKAGTDASCTSGSWTDVGAAATWEFASSSVSDGADITAVLAASDINGQYAKSNPTTTNTNSATTSQDIEYDFHIIGTNIAANTQYSFRVRESDDTVFDAYTTCPTLTTEPGTASLMRHGNVFTEETEQGFFWTD
jgi:hypothetical protein